MTLDLPKRQRLLVILTAALVAVFVLDRVRMSLTAAWRANTAEIAKLRKSVATGRATIASAAQNDRLWAEMRANALAKEPAQAEQDVIAAFDRWGRANNVELSSIRPQWKRGATTQYSLLECRVDATGTLATLSRFIYELERSPLALRVDSVEVSSRDDNGQRLTLGLIVSGLRFAPLERKL